MDDLPAEVEALRAEVAGLKGQVEVLSVAVQELAAAWIRMLPTLGENMEDTHAAIGRIDARSGDPSDSEECGRPAPVPIDVIPPQQRCQEPDGPLAVSEIHDRVPAESLDLRHQ